MTYNRKFLEALESQIGKPYRWGAEVSPLSNPDPPAFDCAELVQWGLAQAGVRRVRATPIQNFDGSANQYRCARPIPIGAARKTVGALVFVSGPHGVHHVAVVAEAEQLDVTGRLVRAARIIEAPGRGKYVRKVPIRASFTLAAKVDELYREAA